MSCATGVFGKEKVFGESWECSGSRESREGKLGTGVDFHQTSAGLRICHVMSDRGEDLRGTRKQISPEQRRQLI